MFRYTSLVVLVTVIIRIGLTNYPLYFNAGDTNVTLGVASAVAIAYDYESDTDDAFDYESDSESNPDTVDDFLPSDLNYLLSASAVLRSANPINRSGRSPPPEHRPPCYA